MHTLNTAKRKTTDTNTSDVARQGGKTSELALLNTKVILQVRSVTLDETADTTETAEEGEGILLQKTEESSDDGDGQSTYGVRVGDLICCQ